MELRPFLKRKRRSFLVSQNTMRRHENPPTILINELLQTPSEFRELWSRSSFLFPFRVANFLPKFFFFFFEKIDATSRHVPRINFHGTSAEISRELRYVASREHASTRGILKPPIRVITRITRQFFHAGYRSRSIDPFTRGKEFRRCDSSRLFQSLRSISILVP